MDQRKIVSERNRLYYHNYVKPLREAKREEQYRQEVERQTKEFETNQRRMAQAHYMAVWAMNNL
jgi:hypothetical protein